VIHTFLLMVLGYVREIADVVVLGFVVIGVINAVVNKDAVAYYLSDTLLLSTYVPAGHEKCVVGGAQGGPTSSVISACAVSGIARGLPVSRWPLM